ncbi:MAG: RHS repeat-associated core domain-containing protein [Bacteroidales bacterium]|nr:RHS repeat-associated core domain-containing protein [Bacteroidales bacterium]
MRNIYQSTTRHYVFSPISGNLVAVNFKQGNKSESYYAITDNVGSVLKLVDTGVHDKFSATYTPFGVRTITKNELGYNFPRGFTMHEHLDEFGIINANARLYDPYLARFVSPDPWIQDVTNSQNFNRYSYCLNNPLKYTDPTGEFFQYIIGGVLGGIQGFSIGKSAGLSGWNLFGATVAGVGIGAISGGIASSVSSNSMIMSNTLGLMAGSLSNSVGMSVLGATYGQNIPVSMSFGFGSVTFGENGLEFGYLGEKGNSGLENVGYGLGVLANISDFLIGFNPQSVDLVTEHSDGTGHSAIVESVTKNDMPKPDGNKTIISVGPDRQNDPNGSWHRMRGCNSWNNHSRNGEIVWRNTLKVNKKTMNKYANWLNRRCDAGKFTYSVEFSSCVTHTSLALNASGIFNIGIHPYCLNFQMYLWRNGIRPWTFIPLIVNQ